jgi:predicted transposase/invertase (TIGR01784 family)
LIDSAWLENREISRAMDRLKYLSADDDVRAIADLRQKDLNDRISEKNVAIQKAIKGERAKAEKRERELKAKAKAEKRESAKSLLAMGLSVDQIIKALGFSVEEINEIKKKVQ